ncbi:unnamed protein product [Sphagnum balticum]
MSASWRGETSSSFGLHESSQQQELYDVPAASEDDPASAVEVDASVAGAAVVVQELNWKELLQVLVENWPWLLYAVVWKLNPHNRAIVWHQGKFNGGNLQPPGALLQQHDPAAESRRLEAIFYTVYKSCTFTISPSSGYAARALFQESPLWWTNDMPRLVTEERKDRFLQQSGIKTMVCLPGRGSDGNIYCLEIASTHLILETSELLQTFKQLFMSGSSVFPSLSALENVILLPAAGGSECSSSRGGHVEIAAAATWFHAHNYGAAAVVAPREVAAPAHAFGNHMQSPSWDDHELGILDPDDDHEEIASLQQQEVFTHELESMDSAAAGRSTVAADAIPNFMQLQPTMALDSLIMQGYQNMDQLDSETTDPAAAVAALQHPPAMSSVINFAALFDTVFGTNSDPEIVSSSCNDDDDDQVQDLEPFHDLLQQQHHQNITLGHHDGHELAQQSSAAMSTNPYEIMYSDPELQSPAADAATSAATSVRPAAQPDSCLPDRFPRATDQLVVDPAMDLHLGASFLDLDAEPAAAVKNPVDHHRQQQQQQQQQNPSREQCSPFKSLEPSRRLSKRRRLDAVDNSMQRSETASGIFGAAAAAGPSSTAAAPPRPRQSMIELWKSLSGRIQESDRIQRVEQRVQETLMRLSSSSRHAHAGDTSAVVLQQLQLQGAAGAAAVSRSTSDDLLPAPGRGLFDMMSRDVLDQLQTYNIPADWQAPVAHVDQAQIAEKHKMKERDRRSRIKTEINALDSLLPVSKKKDTLSILTKAIHYIRQLKDQIAVVRVEKAGSATFLQQQTHDRPAVVQAAAAAAGPASSSSFSSINNLSCCSTRVAVRPAEAHVIADGASNRRDLVIDVKSRNNPQTLIHILSIVRDSALEVGSLSSDDAGVIQGRMAFSLTVPVPSSLQQTCDKVKEALEREILQNIAAHDMTSSRLNAPSDASPDSETPTDTLTPSPGVKKHKGMSAH